MIRVPKQEAAPWHARGRRKRPGRRGISAGMAALMLTALPLVGQTEADTTAAPPPPPFDSSRVRVSVLPQAAAVGVALWIPVGAASDEPGQEGGAHLVGRALEQRLRTALEPLGAQVDVDTGHEGTTILVGVARDRWRETVDILDRRVFVEPLEQAALEREQALRLARMTFEEGAPVQTFRNRVWDVLFGPSHPWGRPPGGTRVSVEALRLGPLASATVGQAQRLRSRVAIVGSVDADQARDALAGLVAAHRRGVGSEGSARVPWSTAEQVRIDAEITSTWVAVALPLPVETPTWEVELLAHHLRQTLESDPPRPGLVSPEVLVLAPPSGWVILARFAVWPDRAEDWARHVVETARLERDAPPDERFFGWERRRFRSAWLRARRTPVQRAEALVRARTAEDALTLPSVTDVSRAALERISSRLGPPRILWYGPDLQPDDAPLPQR